MGVEFVARPAGRRAGRWAGAWAAGAGNSTYSYNIQRNTTHILKAYPPPPRLV